MEDYQQITLEAWANEVQERLDSFIKYWKLMQKNNRTNHPLLMLKGDWDEQFIFFSAEDE